MQPSRPFSSRRATVERIRRIMVVIMGIMFAGCVRENPDPDVKSRLDPSEILEPPGHAPGEPHPFVECPDGACPRTQPGYLFSGEFHETVVDLRVASCSVEDLEYSALGQLIRHRHPEDQHGQRREVVYSYANDGRLRETTVDPNGRGSSPEQA